MCGKLCVAECGNAERSARSQNYPETEQETTGAEKAPMGRIELITLFRQDCIVISAGESTV